MPLKSKQPRIVPLEEPYGPDEAAALERLGPPIQLFRVLARRPELAGGVAGWGSYYLSRKSALTLRERELCILRTTALCGADYEWGVHVAYFADKVGLTDDHLHSLAQGGPGDSCWSSPEAAWLRAVDELHSTHDLSDDTWRTLVDTHEEDAALELLLLTGWYHAISYAVRALRLPLEPTTTRIDQA
jgi:alkylhydroperoxidase family enzyme